MVSRDHRFLGAACHGSLYWIKGLYFQIDILYNDEYNSLEERQFPDGFLFFRYLIEVHSKEATAAYCVDIVSRILTWLWLEQKMPAVAACDYEEQLPFSGEKSRIALACSRKWGTVALRTMPFRYPAN